MASEAVDFFISYNSADRAWAEWIAWQLEEDGYSTRLQAWDILPGSNFVLEMQEATSNARRTIAVLSPEYLEASFTQPEWAAALARDPTGTTHKLVPVMVRDCELPGLLRPIAHVDLKGVDEDDARQTLLSIAKARLKPSAPPPFPGRFPVGSREPPPFPPQRDRPTEPSGRASAAGIDDHRSLLLTHHVRTEVQKLNRVSPRLPAELIKETNDDPGDLLRLIADLARLPSIPQQLSLAKTRHFAALYADSTAEYESMLFCLSFLREQLETHGLFDLGEPVRIYDAGCADGALRTVLGCLSDPELEPHIHYVGQDLNSDWRAYFSDGPGQFVEAILPEIEEAIPPCRVVCCINTLHLLAANPILIAATLHNFNRLLVPGGLCIIVVPEKEGEPGMLDLLEEVAQRAQFDVTSAGRYRIRHALNPEPARNTATYLALVATKVADVNRSEVRRLVGAGFFRGGLIDKAAHYGVSDEEDLSSETRAWEEGLQDVLHERNPDLRFLRHALLYIRDSIASEGPGALANAASAVESRNLELSNLCLQQVPRTDIADAAGNYLMALLEWITVYLHGREIEDSVRHFTDRVRRMLQQPSPDSRIRIEGLNVEHVAKLVRNLVEVCSHYGIDIRASLNRAIERRR